MLNTVASRTLLGLGAACLFAGLASEVSATISYNHYCWHTNYANCGYHPCKCEDSSILYGCSIGRNSGPTSFCNAGTTNTCSTPTTSCGFNVPYTSPASCSDCNGTAGMIPCNKLHECTHIE